MSMARLHWKAQFSHAVYPQAQLSRHPLRRQDLGYNSLAMPQLCFLFGSCRFQQHFAWIHMFCRTRIQERKACAEGQTNLQKTMIWGTIFSHFWSFEPHWDHLGPPWYSKGLGTQSKTTFSGFLLQTGTTNGDLKMTPGATCWASELPRVCIGGFFLDLCFDPYFSTQNNAKMQFFKDAWHGWNITNSISKPLFP